VFSQRTFQALPASGAVPHRWLPNSQWFPGGVPRVGSFLAPRNIGISRCEGSAVRSRPAARAIMAASGLLANSREVRVAGLAVVAAQVP
jgi:hypothetical protein